MQNETYVHDNLNRTTGVTSTIDNATGTNAYNKSNHLTTFEGEPVISDKIGKPLTIGATEFTYDDLGQRISQQATVATLPEKEYSWNVDGTLSETTNALSAVNYDYSTSGLLNERSSNGVSKNFVWDETAENALMLSDGDYEYVYGATLVPVAQIELATGDVEYLHSDVNGSVIAVTAESGLLAGITNYGAYGKRLGSANSRFGYAGEWTDPDTTYTYLRARWYDSSTGSFLSKDPIYQVTSEAYGYAGGNPLVRIDPSGLFFKKAWDAGKNMAKTAHDFTSGVTESVIKGDWSSAGNKIKDAGELIGSRVSEGARVIGESIESATKPARKFLHDNAGTISSVLGAVAYASAFIPGGQAIAVIAGGSSLIFSAYSLKANIEKCAKKIEGGCDPTSLAFDTIGTFSGVGALGFKMGSKILKSDSLLIKSENADASSFLNSFAALSVDSVRKGMTYADSRKC